MADEIRTTRELVELLQDANPRAGLHEERVRLVLRRGRIPRPRLLGGTFAWTEQEARALADALGVRFPEEVGRA